MTVRQVCRTTIYVVLSMCGGVGVDKTIEVQYFTLGSLQGPESLMSNS